MVEQGMRKRYDLCVKNGEYTDRQGQTKVNWKNIGSIWQGDRGPFMFLDRTFNPAGVETEPGKGSIFVSLFEPRRKDDDRRSGGGTYTPPPEAYEQPGDDMNFKFKDGPRGSGNDADIPF